jgi:preprotein translocase subunit SecA
MSAIDIVTRLKRVHRRLNGCTVHYDPSLCTPALARINDLRPRFQDMTEVRLREESRMIRDRTISGESPDSLLPEAFALVRETAWRTLGQRPFETQILGGIVLHQGRVAQLQTGEGKTLAAVFPAFLNALTGRGVHILTFNDYLARRDAAWMGPVYALLGLSVGCVQEGMSAADRRAAYDCDVTYLTAREAGFDFLRDNLSHDVSWTVHRGFNFAIVDEADSILIDEARVPLVIAGVIDADDSPAARIPLSRIAAVVAGLKHPDHVQFDSYERNCFLNDAGLRTVESELGQDNLYGSGNEELLSYIHYALHAHFLLHRDRDYIVRNGIVELVDDCTGRVADKRRWPDGLQAAVEAKEGCAVRSRGTVLNSITLQHFLNRYTRIAGMTATAEVSEEELREFYGLHVVIVPPNRPCVRVDHPDAVFRTREAKIDAVIGEIVRVHGARRPVLVGTRTVEESTALAERLHTLGITCGVLNAKRDEYEAQIIARAGKAGAVTVSTNMAGRGTDIRLGGPDERDRDLVVSLGGLYVIGTNRHESRRIDDQLRGRAGRQGDPGSSRFFVSLEDGLFVKYRIRELISMGRKSCVREIDGRIEDAEVDREIARVQRIIEGQNLEIRKTLCRYSLLIEQQRRIIAQLREEIVSGESAMEFFRTRRPDRFIDLEKGLRPDRVRDLCRHLSLVWLDLHWSRYLGEVTEIRDSIHLRRIGGQDPLFEFRKTVIEAFESVLEQIDCDRLQSFDTVGNEGIDPHDAGPKSPSATWTYLINDNPFEEKMIAQMSGNMGVSAWAGLLWPLWALYLLFRRRPRDENP